MNVYVKQKQTHRYRKLVVTDGERDGGGANRGIRLRDTNYYV